jgi:TP901-1 family phage major tail protein
MAVQKGKDLLIRIDDGTGALVAVAGLRARRIALGAEAVDVTHAESPGRWRELLAEAGPRRASVTGAGVFRDEASDALLRALFFAAGVRRFEIVVPALGRIRGPFQITALDYRGDHAGEMAFEMTLESAGELAFVAG